MEVYKFFYLLSLQRYKGSDVNDLGAYADMTDAYDVNGVMTSCGDGDVDMADLGIFSDYYLTSKKYNLEDGWILEEKE